MGRPQTLETKKKLSIAARQGFERIRKDPVAWLEFRRKQAEGTARRYKNKEANRQKYLIDTPFDDLGSEAKRSKILLEQENKCGKCGKKEWFGEVLTLEIDHSNGNHQDDRRENMVALCPNCHSITPTWRGRNKKSCNRVSDDNAIAALKSEPTIRQALIKVGLTPRGGNYKRFTKLKQSIDNS